MVDPKGTANLLHQHAEYNKLSDEYSPEVAAVLTQKNLSRSNVQVSVEQVDGWHQINEASIKGHLDLESESQIATAQATAVVDAILRPIVHALPEPADVVDESEVEDVDDEDQDEDEDEDEQDERPSLGDIFGYEDDEDNEEAAFDHILKLQENAG
ncbi:hypothetical protein JFV30_10420 [Pseudomonas sp. TH32]|uniref:hypothetical protein n=1 Tax=Pseudomonas sp. TH32 TaxID=2796397 RepID=UPI00191453FC|nr:hypothetical protein [Pseudomonas sp. TH32]MBK5437243.1 hypothetical protein [Pseudomonas sp. TH32]